jgi:uncharacterized damage-inducible protein DinB
MMGSLTCACWTLAAHNTFANRRLYEACTHLCYTELKASRLNFFGSIHGTLNHLSRSSFGSASGRRQCS